LVSAPAPGVLLQNRRAFALASIVGLIPVAVGCRKVLGGHLKVE